jgi:hypothetical protein
VNAPEDTLYHRMILRSIPRGTGGDGPARATRDTPRASRGPHTGGIDSQPRCSVTWGRSRAVKLTQIARTFVVRYPLSMREIVANPALLRENAAV